MATLKLLFQGNEERTKESNTVYKVNSLGYISMRSTLIGHPVSRDARSHISDGSGHTPSYVAYWYVWKFGHGEPHAWPQTRGRNEGPSELGSRYVHDVSRNCPETTLEFGLRKPSLPPSFLFFGGSIKDSTSGAYNEHTFLFFLQASSWQIEFLDRVLRGNFDPDNALPWINRVAYFAIKGYENARAAMLQYHVARPSGPERETENCNPDLYRAPPLLALFQARPIIHTIRSSWHRYREYATNPTYQSGGARWNKFRNFAARSNPRCARAS